MSGVINENGQQWEHCNNCGNLVKIQDIHDVEPNDNYPYGVQYCHICYIASPSERDHIMATWLFNYILEHREAQVLYRILTTVLLALRNMGYNPKFKFHSYSPTCGAFYTVSIL